MNPFFSQECAIPDSQEEPSHFINDSSPSDIVLLSSSGFSSGDEGGGPAPPYRITDYPGGIFICTPPDSQAGGGGDVTRLDDDVHRQEGPRLGLGVGFPEEETVKRSGVSTGKSPVEESSNFSGEGIKIGSSRIGRKISWASKGKLPQKNGSVVEKSLVSKRKSREVDCSRESGDSPDGGHDRGCGFPASLASSPSKFSTKESPLKPGSGDLSFGKGKKPLNPAQEEVRGLNTLQACVNPEAKDRDMPVTDEFSKFRYVKYGIPPRCPPLKLLKDAIGIPRPAPKGVQGSRKLPPSIQIPGKRDMNLGTGTATQLRSPISEEQTRNTGSVACVLNPSLSHQNPPLEKATNSIFPANLLDVVEAFSGNLDRRFEGVSILEIAAMKGIHIPPPQWWRAGGYDAQKHKKPE